jgi:hypothetical protein
VEKFEGLKWSKNLSLSQLKHVSISGGYGAESANSCEGQDIRSKLIESKAANFSSRKRYPERLVWWVSLRNTKSGRMR